MPLRFRVLPTDDTRPDGQPRAPGPLVERAVELPDFLTEIRIGRRADVELPLPFAALSGVHARLSLAADGWFVEDLGSTNGTWVGGERLRPGQRRPLPSGAELGLAGVRLRFEGEASVTPAAQGTATIARRLVDDLLRDAPEGAPALRVVSGAPPAALCLVTLGRTYLVGRGATCALTLPVEEVSREHAAFVRGAEGVVVRDLGSKNGVLVGGARVPGERPLVDGDLVTVGPVTLAFDDPVARYLRELEQMPPERAASPTIAESVATDSPREPSPEPATVPHPSSPRLSAAPTSTSTRLIAAVAAATLLLLAVTAVALFWPTR